jgi:hypothetical protein
MKHLFRICFFPWAAIYHWHVVIRFVNFKQEPFHVVFLLHPIDCATVPFWQSATQENATQVRHLANEHRTMPTTSQCVAAAAILAGSASAFMAPQPMALQNRGRVTTQSRAKSLKMVLVDKPGTGENRMTPTAFGEPLVEKKEFPGTIHGYQVCSRFSLVCLCSPRGAPSDCRGAPSDRVVYFGSGWSSQRWK